MKQVDQAVNSLDLYPGHTSFNLGEDTAYPDRFLWFSSVHPGKYHGNTLD
jgi:hypothetical protein